MNPRLLLRLSILALAIASITAMVSAQVRTGPPPSIKEIVDGVIKAVNAGQAEAWEAFAQARFAPALLQKQSPAERARMYQSLVDDFGTIALDGVRREGPEAPLQLNVKGAKAAGVIMLELDSTQSKIAGLGVKIGGGDRDMGGLPPPPIDKSLTAQEIDRRLDGYFAKLAADEVFSGVALVARNGVPVFFKAYGLARRETKQPNTPATRFNIGSINKAFTQAAIRQLVEAGKLSYTDTLGKFFPDYPQAVSRAATVEQLLAHRGGLADFFGPAFDQAAKDKFASNADYFAFVGSLPPTFAPGERAQYCNGCYIALGAIIARASGMPYEKYVAENVFARAEMTSTGYPRSDRPEADIAIGYTRRTIGTTQDPGPKTPALRSNISLHGVTGSAAGGGYSTALDLLTYVKAVRAGRFPGAEREMGIAGGAPGTNAVVETRGEWTVIMLSNFDPPTAVRLGGAIADALDR